jgi:1-acyl-sn-glycerol-3-phosphate acyltransferase
MEDAPDERGLKGKIICSNHPSFIDVVILISRLPNADCIINSHLLKNPFVHSIVSALYIPNSLDFNELCAACKKSLAGGNNLIIFPEGTRTCRSGPIFVKKGAARISYLSGVPILPIRIDANDMWGLGKKDPFYAYNHTERYTFHSRPLPEISPADYSELPYSIAVKHITEQLKLELYTDQERERMS